MNTLNDQEYKKTKYFSFLIFLFNFWTFTHSKRFSIIIFSIECRKRKVCSKRQRNSFFRKLKCSISLISWQVKNWFSLKTDS